MKDMAFLFLMLTGKEGIIGQLLLSAQQANENLSEAPSARLCYVPRLTPSRECININALALPGPSGSATSS